MNQHRYNPVELLTTPSDTQYLSHLLRSLSGFQVQPTGRPDHEQQHCYHHVQTVNPEAVTAFVELLVMGMRMAETY